MIAISKPQQAPIDVYLACVRRTRDKVLKSALQAEAARVAQRSDAYVLKAAQQELHTFPREKPLHISGDQLSNVYDRVLVNGGERPLYDEFKSKARFRRCPLCGQRDVQTLDHYLPQSEYPELCVTPCNLVPCCRECNSAKLAYVPGKHAEQTFHPYFDDWSSTVVLTATVDVDAFVSVAFSIATAEPTPTWIERAKFHFNLLELDSLYSEHAAVELVQRKANFRSTYQSMGAAGLRNDLESEAHSRSLPFPNAWQPALYRGLAASDAFCANGFEKIEE
jgi:5-methylcytosine-specific restriction endonuclease McrA